MGGQSTASSGLPSQGAPGTDASDVNDASRATAGVQIAGQCKVSDRREVARQCQSVAQREIGPASRRFPLARRSPTPQESRKCFRRFRSAPGERSGVT